MFGLGAPSEIEGRVDVLIIGAGPAGLTAAVYVARKKLSTGIVSKDLGGQVAWTLGIENYMGYQYITGRELTAKFEEQVRQFPIPLVMDEVSKLRKDDDLFRAETAGGRTIEARSVIIASGKRPKEIVVSNEKRMVGRGVSYCSTCDGPLFANMNVAIIGGGNSAVQAAIDMGQVASKVYIISRNPWRAEAIIAEKAEGVKNLEKRVGYDAVDIVGENKVEGLRIREKATGKEELLQVRGIFIEVGLVPNTSFVNGLVELNEYGEVIVDCQCRTNVPGLFAAGDVTTVHEKQIIVAVGEGAKAALSAYEYLLRK